MAQSVRKYSPAAGNAKECDGSSLGCGATWTTGKLRLRNEAGQDRGSSQCDHSGDAGKLERDRERRFPWQLGLSVVAWVVLGALLIVSALGGSSTTSGADQASIDKIQGSLGDSAVATDTTAHPTLLLLRCWSIRIRRAVETTPSLRKKRLSDWA